MITGRTFVTLSMALTLASAEAADDQAKLKNSLQTWNGLKEKCGGNYSYKIRFSSFAGFGNETVIVVRENKVAERRYRTFNNQAVLVVPGAKKPKGDGWVENGKTLDSHKRGAPLKTLDELYAEAEAVLKRELPQHERRYVRFNKQGLLTSCFTVDTRIADDAPTKGVNISSITLGMAKGATIFKSPNGKPYPKHWGEPPRIQTRDLRPLPGGYGKGSGTLAKWIKNNLEADANKK